MSLGADPPDLQNRAPIAGVSIETTEIKSTEAHDDETMIARALANKVHDGDHLAADQKNGRPAKTAIVATETEESDQQALQTSVAEDATIAAAVTAMNVTEMETDRQGDIAALVPVPDPRESRKAPSVRYNGAALYPHNQMLSPLPM